jgi:hypothetical protein
MVFHIFIQVGSGHIQFFRDLPLNLAGGKILYIRPAAYQFAYCAFAASQISGNYDSHFVTCLSIVFLIIHYYFYKNNFIKEKNKAFIG